MDVMAVTFYENDSPTPNHEKNYHRKEVLNSTEVKNPRINSQV